MSDKAFRTEKGTGRRRQKARERGQVLRSREVSAALAFAAGAGLMIYASDSVWAALKDALRFYLAATATAAETHPETLLLDAMRRAAVAAGPIAALAVGASVAGAHLQSPIGFSTEPLMPDLGRISPGNAARAIFSSAGLFNLLKGALGMAALGYACWSVVEPRLSSFPTLGQSGPRELALWTGDLAGSLLLRAVVIFAAFAAVDYGLSYRRYEESLKMTRQEVKDEAREVEGNPQIKARVRRAQRAMARRRMMAEVPTATVVVTNPTHIAVALAYDQEKNPAPRVVAKGKGELAARIRDLARRHEVLIYEDPPLARALYPIELGEVIPKALYKAVAEVLAYLVRVQAVRGIDRTPPAASGQGV